MRLRPGAGRPEVDSMKSLIRYHEQQVNADTIHTCYYLRQYLMPLPASAVAGGIFLFTKRIILCFTTFPIAFSRKITNFAVTLRRETPLWSRSEGGHYIMKAFTALDSWLFQKSGSFKTSSRMK